jgi:hypothetical protein
VNDKYFARLLGINGHSGLSNNEQLVGNGFIPGVQIKAEINPACTE